MNNMSHYQYFAPLFGYPYESIFEQTEACKNLIAEKYPEVLDEFLYFAEYIAKTPLSEIEEVFTKTFHIQAICYLDLGYVMFGEDYKRGDFLSNMIVEQANAGNDCGDELADNLTSILTLYPKIKEQVFAEDLATRIVIPSLKEMIKEFDEAVLAFKSAILKKKHKVLIQEGLKNKNIYKSVLIVLLHIFEKDFKHVDYQGLEAKPLGSDAFLSSCGTCSTPSTTT
ncbi:MAG: hypothetical protein GY810_15810 [Aureispira sp.]|nr:hypothetical protein [Aureispira sp.]